MGYTIERIELLLLIAAGVAMLASRLRLPYTVGLVVAGAVLAFSPLTADLTLTKEIIFTAFLPPLVFEAAFYIQWSELRRDLPVVLTIASLGVCLGAGIVAAGMHWFVGWSWPVALVFGALIAATDPVSVIAVFKETGVHGRLRLLVESESLLNDGAAAVLFGLTLALAQGMELTAGEAVLELVKVVGGGVLCGLAVGWSIILLAGRTDDHLNNGLLWMPAGRLMNYSFSFSVLSSRSGSGVSKISIRSSRRDGRARSGTRFGSE